MRFRTEFIAKVFLLAIATIVLAVLYTTSVIAKETPNYDLKKGYVNLSSYKSRLNVRKDSNNRSEILAKLCAGDIVTIIGELDDFYNIECCIDSEIVYGYVQKDYIIIPEEDYDECELISAAVITSTSSENRDYNISLACEKINDLTLKNEEKFDWYGENGVGPASKENGFKQATVISGGKYVKGYGGGVCQVSTALYNAIYDLNIEPEEHHHHSLRSSYVEKGMDATVSYPNKNFVFSNTEDYTIKIKAFSDGGQVTVLLYKMKE